MRRNKKTVRFDELISVLEDHGFTIRPAKGSHIVAKRVSDEGTVSITIVKPHQSKFVKAFYVTSVLKEIDNVLAEQASEEEDNGRED
ncbi:MAG: hypothetical protein Crog4KO_36490 [Crocinitomicaceae bacterium]